jgi:two-component system response regulator RpaA
MEPVVADSLFGVASMPGAYLPPGRIFTTGQVARICGVAARTVSKWFDSGRLKGYRIPGSQDRRIPEAQLVAFLTTNGMPVPPALQPGCILAYGAAQRGPVPGLVVAADAFAFGALLVERNVRAALIGDESGRDTALQACRLVRARCPRAAVLLVLSEDAGDVVAIPGALVLRKPLDWSEVVGHLGSEKER